MSLQSMSGPFTGPCTFPLYHNFHLWISVISVWLCIDSKLHEVR